ncbi:MAG: hypothetical protein KC619_04015 [Myxococcales bacterium]|nr:hypothetical protein [Myxococcales bacterium]
MATTRRHAKRGTTPKTTAAGTRWTCRACGLLLGIVRDGTVEIRESKATRYVLRGSVTADCRRCGSTTSYGPSLCEGAGQT